MSKGKALLNCTFSWGKVCHVYEDSIEVAGKFYNLDNLTSIHPTYRKLFGVPSARLELSFGPRRLTLRGIADPEIARQMVSHFLSFCPEWSTAKGPCARPIKGRDFVRAQARAWERTNKLPALPKASQEGIFDAETEVRLPTPEIAQAEPELEPAASESLPFEEDEEILAETFSETSLQEQAKQICEQETSKHVQVEEVCEQEATQQEHVEKICERDTAEYEQAKQICERDIAEEATTALVVCESSSPAQVLRSQPLLIPRVQPPLRSVQLINVERKRLVSSSMPTVSAIKPSVLPIIHVPVRLQPGECAHYSIGALLCGERISDEDVAFYPPLDNGLLILTNRRIFYIGKHSQLILPYLQLWYVSLLRDAIALHVQRQFRRIIIEVEHASEWASRIEQLALLARRAPAQSGHLPLSASALITLETSSELEGVVTQRGGNVRLPGYFRPALREARVVDARTVSLDEQDRPAQAFLPEEAQTIALPRRDDAGPGEGRLLAIEAQATREFQRMNPLIVEALPTQELAKRTIETQATQEFSQTGPSIEALVTQEFVENNAQCFNQQNSQAVNQSSTAQKSAVEEHECEEIKTCPLGGQDDEDERTLCLRDRHKTSVPGIPQRVQVRRKLTSAGDLDDTQVKSRRAMRGRIRRSFQS